MEVDDTVGDNEYRANFYVSGKLEGRSPNDEEVPFLGLGALSADGASDRNGTIRSGEVDLGPIERP